jgi:23S rRNA pseudouridine1911/1915/1917 synthase
MSAPTRDLSDAFYSHHYRFALYNGGTLFTRLRELLPDKEERYSWEERASLGGIYINGLVAIHDQLLPTPALVEYYEPKFPLDDIYQFYPSFDPKWIVYEDDYLLACNKPSRLPTMPAKEQNKCSLRKYLDDYVGAPVHCPSRLDMSTQGLVIVSKKPESHGLLQKLFEQKKIQKQYLFLTHKKPDWENIVVRDPIGKTDEHPVLRVINGKDAKSAETEFTFLKTHDFIDANGIQHSGSLIKASPKTGRTHQIRIHAASIDLPIVGDKFYGSVPFDCLTLLSFRLDFIHPIYEKEITIEIPKSFFPLWAD